MKIKIENLKCENNCYKLPITNLQNLKLIKRTKDTISGKHYHNEKLSFKSPEIMFLIHGEAEFYFKDIKTNEEKTITIKEPSKITIHPYIYHEIKALTDIMILDNYDEKHEATIKNHQHL